MIFVDLVNINFFFKITLIVSSSEEDEMDNYKVVILKKIELRKHFCKPTASAVRPNPS